VDALKDKGNHIITTTSSIRRFWKPANTWRKPVAG